jgi:hypothetical protein
MNDLLSAPSGSSRIDKSQLDPKAVADLQWCEQKQLAG